MISSEIHTQIAYTFWCRYEDMTMDRNIFDELVEGFDALAEERQGKRTLRSHPVALDEVPDVTADELIALREKLHMSRPVFAMYLRTNRSEEHTSELQSRGHLVCRLLLE